MEQEIIYKSKGRRGTRSIRQCKNCNKSFSELNLKINAGGGKFCSDKCYKEYRKKNKKILNYQIDFIKRNIGII